MAATAAIRLNKIITKGVKYMKKFFLFITLACIFITGCLSSEEPGRSNSPSPESFLSAGHPHLLFDRTDIPALKEKIKNGVPAAAFARLKDTCDQLPPTGPIEEGKYIDPLVALGIVYQISGEPKYGERLAAEVERRRVENIPLADGTVSHEKSPNIPFDWALVYDLGYDRFTPESRKWLHDWLVETARAMHEARYAKPCWPAIMGCNWDPPMILQAARWGLAVYGEDGYDPAWAELAARDFRELLSTWIGRDGECGEHGAYFGYAFHMDPGLKTWALHRKADILRDTNLAKTPEWIAYDTVPPVASWFPLDDCNLQPYNNYALYLTQAMLPDSRLMDWHVSRHGEVIGTYMQDVLAALLLRREPVSPLPPELPRARLFRDHNLVHFRSDWGPDAFAASFAVRWYGGHCHGDMGAFTLWSHGKFWAIDSGYGQRWADAHNVVLVDGEGPNMEGGSGQVAVGGELLQYFDSPLATVTACDSTDSWRYTFAGHGVAGGRSPYSGGLAQARRTFAVLWGDDTARIPPYALVHDHLLKDDADHTYDWLLQTWNGHAIEIRERGAEIHCPFDDRWLEGPRGLTEPTEIAANSLEQDVEIKEAGDYSLYLFGRGDDQWNGATINAQINGKMVGYVAVSGPTWGWNAITRKPVALQPGKHTVRLQQNASRNSPRLRWLMLSRKPDLDLPTLVKPINDADSVTVAFGGTTRIQGDGWKWVDGSKDPAKLQVEFLLPEKITLRQDLYDRTARWREVHPRLHAETTTKAGRFLAMLYPREPGAAPLNVQVFPTRYAFRHQIVWPGAVDYVAEATLTTGGHGTDGTFAVVRVPIREGSPPGNAHLNNLSELPDDTQYLLVNGTKLQFKRDLVKLTDDLLGELNWQTSNCGLRATVARQGKRLEIQVQIDPLANYPLERRVRLECFGPGVETVTFNGEPATFDRDGKLICVRGKGRLHESTMERIRQHTRESYEQFLLNSNKNLIP